MIKIKASIAFIIFISFPAISAPGNTIDITTNTDVDRCIQQFGDNSDECLEDISDKSDDELQKTYEDKLKTLQAADYTSWWMGNKAQYDTLIKNFTQSQNDWQKYKIGYCKAATVTEQNTHASGVVMAGCLINMNQRRIEEIALMGESRAK